MTKSKKVRCGLENRRATQDKGNLSKGSGGKRNKTASVEVELYCGGTGEKNKEGCFGTTKEKRLGKMKGGKKS